MPLGITPDQVELADALGKWAASTDGVAVARAAERDPRARFERTTRDAEEMGLFEILRDGGTLLDLAVAMEACATSLLPGPLLGTAVAAVVLPGETPPPTALSLGGGVVLDAFGTSQVLAADGEVVRRGPVPDLEPGTLLDLTRRVGTGTVEGEVVTGLSADRLRDVALTLAAAEASGIARWCLDTAVEHARTREQFGRPIGAFQAVKHLCAEMLETSESVTASAWDAARAHDESPEQHALAAAVAGVVALDGAVEVAKMCIQVLGGIGFTFEHDAHLYLRRALALRALLGPTSAHAARLAQLAAQGLRRESHVALDGMADVRAGVRQDVAAVAQLAPEDRREALVQHGLLMPHWPAPHGRDADPATQLVIDEELAAAGIERPDLGIGAWAAPTLIAHGTAAQQDRFVGPTQRGEITWCQLFSEPGAGSDLASLRTKATRDGDGWRLTGQKVWTSLAHRADWAICLARTSSEGKPHAGITYFLLDMRSSGIEVRPLREITCEAMFNEVFLDDVHVPDDCIVGEVDGGWPLARTTLANERVAMAGSRLGASVELAVELLAERPQAAESVGRAVALDTVVRLLGTRAVLRSLAGQGPGAESSVAKLVGVRSRQDAAELVVTLLGDRVLTGDEVARAALHEQLLTRCLSIAGGTTQVLRNVAGERILGLPRG